MTGLTLSKSQRIALEEIRDIRLYLFPTKPGVWFARSRAYDRMDNLSGRTVRAFEKRGLVQLVPGYASDGSLVREDVRITDAGRVAIGDWAAGEPGTRSYRLRLAAGEVTR